MMQAAAVARGRLPLIAVTSGEPAGVGPELCAQLATRSWPARVVIVGDIELIAARAGRTRVVEYTGGSASGDGPQLEVLHVPCAAPAVAGQLDVSNAPYVLNVLDAALERCLSGEFGAMVTAPVHKGILNDAGIAFSGHTEYLAARTNTPRVVMMLVGGGMRVALATTHLPLARVPAAITRELLYATLRIIHHDLRLHFGIEAPRILVAGLNPHAGEGGHMGREEIEIITPALDALREAGMQLAGPLPADTLFVPHTLQQGDAVLAMYHDQGLPVLKHASFGGGVNVTLGLPILRTSVDHGTALDLAGTGRAEPGSLFAALELAADMVRRRALATLA